MPCTLSVTTPLATLMDVMRGCGIDAGSSEAVAASAAINSMVGVSMLVSRTFRMEAAKVCSAEVLK